MTPRGIRRLLWLSALLLVPLPMLQFGAFVPVARYLFLAGVTLGLIAAEGGGEIPYLFLALMLGHALVYAGVLWGVAWVLARGLSRAWPRGAAGVAWGLALAGLACALLAEPYVTPYSGASLHSNFWVLFQ